MNWLAVTVAVSGCLAAVSGCSVGCLATTVIFSEIAVIIRLKEKEMERNVNIIDLIIINILIINEIILFC